MPLIIYYRIGANPGTSKQYNDESGESRIVFRKIIKSIYTNVLADRHGPQINGV